MKTLSFLNRILKVWLAKDNHLPIFSFCVISFPMKLFWAMEILVHRRNYFSEDVEN